MRSRSIVAIGLVATLASLALVPFGCTFRPPQLQVHPFFQFSPVCFCSGEELFVTREDLGTAVELINWTELQASDGTVLIRFPHGWPNGRTPPMQADWLPLKFRYESTSRGLQEYEIPTPDQPVNIDAPVWLTYTSTSEIPASTDVELELTGTVQEFDQESGTRIDVNLYDVYRDFDGFSWTLPLSDFGSRAGLLAIRNQTGRVMTFRVAGVEGQQQLSPDAVWTLPPPLHPAVEISARYAPATRQLVGRQKGELTKPVNEHYEYTDLYVETRVEVGIQVACRDVE